MDTPQRQLEQLYQHSRQGLIQAVARIVHSISLAEDLTQDAYLQVGQTLKARPIEHMQAFLYQTAVNLAYDHLRTRRSKSRFESSSASDYELSLVPSPTSVEPEHQIDTIRRMQRFQQTLRTLPLRQQQVLILHRLHDLSQKEVAQRLGVSLSTVEKELRRAMQACLAADGVHSNEDHP